MARHAPGHARLEERDALHPRQQELDGELLGGGVHDRLQHAARLVEEVGAQPLQPHREHHRELLHQADHLRRSTHLAIALAEPPANQLLLCQARLARRVAMQRRLAALALLRLIDRLRRIERREAAPLQAASAVRELDVVDVHRLGPGSRRCTRRARRR